MNRRTKVLLIIFILLVLCGSSLIFSYFYLNHKMTNDILNIAKSSVISTEHSTVEQELETENKKTDTTDAEYMDALTGEFADIGKDQKVKKVKEYVNVLEIPQYDILAKIYPDVSRTSLAYGVGHYPQTVEVGKKGNCAIAGHSSVIYDCILNEVKNMQILDSFNVYDKNGKKHVYYVKTMKVVEPTDMYVLDTTDRNRSEFTIITCTNGGKQRLVIYAFEMTKKEKNAITIVIGIIGGIIGLPIMVVMSIIGYIQEIYNWIKDSWIEDNYETKSSVFIDIDDVRESE